MVFSNLLKHSVIVAIDYWLAEWTSPKLNESVSNVTSLAGVGSNSTLSEVCVFWILIFLDIENIKKAILVIEKILFSFFC